MIVGWNGRFLAFSYVERNDAFSNQLCGVTNGISSSMGFTVSVCISTVESGYVLRCTHELLSINLRSEQSFSSFLSPSSDI
jgi:hypothetical protein